jgi:dolichol-phosphate mannosyltransferase
VKRTVIIIPTYNEMENLPHLINQIVALKLGVDILVVDDGSPDGTGDWVAEQQKSQPFLHLIRRAGKQGLGSAYVAGFRWAIENQYDYVFEMDADFSHRPKYLPRFLEEIENADIVLGSRYISGVNVVNWPLSRLLLSYFANVYARWILGFGVCDSTSGFKCIRVDALKKINLSKISSDGYSFQIEVTYKMYCEGLRIKEIPIVFVDRSAGVSKMSGQIVSEALFLLVKLRLSRYKRGK